MLTIRRALAGLLLLACAAACRRSHDTASAVGAFHPLSVGDTIPTYVIRTLAGDTVTIGATGSVMLVNVWATWCESCREEMGDLEQLYLGFGSRGLRVIAVSVDNGDDARVQRFVDAEHLTIPVAHDAAGLVTQRLNTVGVPESYLVDRDGRLAWHQVGGLHENTSGARAAVERALARADQAKPPSR